MKAKSFFKGPGIWIVVVIGMLLLAFATLSPGGSSRIDTDKGLALLTDGGKVEQAKIFDAENRVDLVLKDNLQVDGQDKGKNIQFYYVNARAADVVKAVTDSRPPSGYTDQPVENNWFAGLFSLLIPVILLGVLFWFLLSRMQGGGSKVMQFGKSKAKLVNKDMPQVTFGDVAGADEAVEELEEIKEFLQEPAKFQAVGAKIPKGVLLYGPPGTGKTLLARAVAGGQAFRSSRSPVPTSLKCSSASAHPASATCSSRPRPTRRPSSSWTRSTPSDDTAVPASAAAMTNASRPSTSCWSKWTASTSRPTSS